MRYLIAPDSWKESMTAWEAAKAVERGILRADPKAVCDLMPMADGGEGTLECLLKSGCGEPVRCQASDPVGRIIETEFLWIEETKTAIIEAARACGLMLLKPEERNPDIASSRGVGELILAAIQRGCKNIILTLGGTATNDGGSGMLAALGAEFLDFAGETILPGGLDLRRITDIRLEKARNLTKNIAFTVLCDVDNPLLGEQGATYVFAPQKGACLEALPALERAMANYAAHMDRFGPVEGTAFSQHPGSGAAGGLGYALLFLGQVVFQSGAQYMMKLLKLEERLAQCDLVITGEGSMDSQSLSGKVPVAIAKAASACNKPVFVFAGRIRGDRDSFYQSGITAFFSVVKESAPLQTLLKEGPENLEWTVENFVRSIRKLACSKFI